MADNQTEVDNAASSSEGESSVDGSSGGSSRWKQTSSWVLVVVACILSVLSVVTVFTRNQLLNTDTYVNTVAPLASNPAIQTQVAKLVSENLISRTDVETRVKTHFRPRLVFWPHRSPRASRPSPTSSP